VSKPGGNPLEREYFDYDMSLLRKKNVLMCTKDQLNSRFVKQTLSKVQADVGFVFGAPLLREGVFSIPKNGCVNIHTGLVTHYRGVDSAMWAMHDDRPDLVGATLHYIDKSIDTGSVIDMKTVNISSNDTLDTLFYKSCQVGFDLLFKNFDDIMHNKVKKNITENKGKLYQSKDKTENVIHHAEKNLRRYKNENYFRSM
jgi:methionyl-tRNA formyltransferase